MPKKCANISEVEKTDGMKIGDIDYGVYVEYQGSYYIKINKRKTGEGVCVTCPNGHSVLCNLKLGTLRAVAGDSLVRVFDPSISLRVIRDNAEMWEFKK